MPKAYGRPLRSRPMVPDENCIPPAANERWAWHYLGCVNTDGHIMIRKFWWDGDSHRWSLTADSLDGTRSTMMYRYGWRYLSIASESDQLEV